MSHDTVLHRSMYHIKDLAGWDGNVSVPPGWPGAERFRSRQDTKSFALLFISISRAVAVSNTT